MQKVGFFPSEDHDISVIRALSWIYIAIEFNRCVIFTSNYNSKYTYFCSGTIVHSRNWDHNKYPTFYSTWELYMSLVKNTP